MWTLTFRSLPMRRRRTSWGGPPSWCTASSTTKKLLEDDVLLATILPDRSLVRWEAYSDSDSIFQHTAQVESGKVAELAKRFVSTLQDRLNATSAQRARREDCWHWCCPCDSVGLLLQSWSGRLVLFDVVITACLQSGWVPKKDMYTQD